MKRGMIAMSVVAMMSLQAEELAIADQWKASPEYQKFLTMGGDQSKEALQFREKTVIAITKEKLKPYIESFDPKYKEMMEKKLADMPVLFQSIVADANIRIKEKINTNHTISEINNLNAYIYFYIKSAKDSGGACITNLDKMLTKFPELKGTEIEVRLRTLGELYDSIAQKEESITRRKKSIEQAEKEIDEMKKETERLKKEEERAKKISAEWDKIIKKL